MYAEQFVADLVFSANNRYILWAAIEELVKFSVVAVIALNSIHNDEPIDALVYSIVVALGFSAFENMLFILAPISNGLIAESIVTGNMRFIGATLVHVVSSASIGFALGYTFYKSKELKIFATLIGLFCAIILHAAFNISVVNSNPGETLQTFGWVWGAVVILIILFEEVKVIRPRYV